MTVHISKVRLRPEISVSSSLARSTEQVPHLPVLCSGRPCLTTKNHKTLERGQVYKTALSFRCWQSRISSFTDSASGSGITVPWQESVCKKSITKQAGRGRDLGLDLALATFCLICWEIKASTELSSSHTAPTHSLDSNSWSFCYLPASQTSSQHTEPWKYTPTASFSSVENQEHYTDSEQGSFLTGASRMAPYFLLPIKVQ